MVVLAIDPATVKCGWALFKDNDIIYDTVIAAHEAPLLSRINYIKSELEKIVNKYGVEYIIAEDVPPSMKNIKTLKALYFLQHSIAELAFEYNIPISYVLPSQWRAFHHIKGSRTECKKQAITMTGIEDNDAAESMLILEYFLKNGGEMKWWLK